MHGVPCTHSRGWPTIRLLSLAGGSATVDRVDQAMHACCMSEVWRGFSPGLDIAPEAGVHFSDVDRWSLEARGNLRLWRIECYGAFEPQIARLRSDRVIAAEHQPALSPDDSELIHAPRVTI